MRGTLVAALLLLGTSLSANETDWATIPDGYALDYVIGLNRPRMIVESPEGDLLISSRADAIYRYSPERDEATVLARIEGYPHGLAIRDDALYVATSTALLRSDWPVAAQPSFEHVARIPGTDEGHSSRTLVLGPDNALYVAIGIQGNCSNEYVDASYPIELRRGGVLRLDESQSPPVWTPWVSGLRNPVGIAFDDQGRLLATNNGPDHWGYENPAEMLVRADQGDFFGMPWYQWIDGQLTRDPCIKGKSPRDQSEIGQALATFPARSAPMAIELAGRDRLDPLLDGRAVVALRGSWARRAGEGAESRRSPAIVLVDLDNGKVSPFIGGFQRDDGHRYARPVGLLLQRDGTLWFTSDDGEYEGLFRVTPHHESAR
ncbi:PQQ-dependent sugar dehydrogenase [Gammaproteobacteria bacterium]|nr:PQQ-dependent sugar dehydrogenase [Gammaproteobacteria bacterium]